MGKYLWVNIPNFPLKYQKALDFGVKTMSKDFGVKTMSKDKGTYPKTKGKIETDPP